VKSTKARSQNNQEVQKKNELTPVMEKSSEQLNEEIYREVNVISFRRSLHNLTRNFTGLTSP
jgi:hypothetical protein